MKIRRSMLSMTAICLAGFANAAAASPEAWSRADSEYEAQHYAQALEIYVALAAADDARAAEVAGHMLSLGERLYGESVRRDPARASQLLSQAAAAGRPVAQYLLGRTNLATAEPVK